MSALEGELHSRLARAPRSLPGPAELADLVRRRDPLRPASAVQRSVADVLARVHGLGLIEPLLADPLVTDLMVNGPGPVWVERAGELIETDVTLTTADLALLVERIVAPLGRRADPVHALVDGRLPDGSRVHVVVPPIAVDGPCVTVRRFGVRARPLDELASEPVVSVLRTAVERRCNLVVSGGTGSGKTTLLNALAALLPEGERVVTVEDAAELRLGTRHVVRLEARPAVHGIAEVTIRDLVRNALRMRPDRLIVGEVRGAEAVDLLAAMNTGHDGCCATVHANSALGALARIETLALFDGALPADAVRRQLADAIDLVVHVARQPGGSRQVTEVAEVVAPTDPGSAPTVRQLVADGRVVGGLKRVRR